MKRIQVLSAVLALSLGLSLASSLHATSRGDYFYDLSSGSFTRPAEDADTGLNDSSEFFYDLTTGSRKMVRREKTPSEKAAEFRAQVRAKVRELERMYKRTFWDIQANYAFAQRLAVDFCAAAKYEENLSFAYRNLTPINHYKEQLPYIRRLSDVTSRGLPIGAISFTSRFARDYGGVYRHNTTHSIPPSSYVYIGDTEYNVHDLQSRIRNINLLLDDAYFFSVNNVQAEKTFYELETADHKLSKAQLDALTALGYSKYTRVSTLAFDESEDIMDSIRFYTKAGAQENLAAIVRYAYYTQRDILHLGQLLSAARANLNAYRELYQEKIVRNKNFADVMHGIMTRYERDICPLSFLAH